MERSERPPTTAEQIEEPAKVLRVATMLGTLLEELRHGRLDHMGREHLQAVYEAAVDEVTGSLSAGLRSELLRMRPPLPERPASESDFRVAQAQLFGWLEGLLQGTQAEAVVRPRHSRGTVGPLRF